MSWSWSTSRTTKSAASKKNLRRWFLCCFRLRCSMAACPSILKPTRVTTWICTSIIASLIIVFFSNTLVSCRLQIAKLTSNVPSNSHKILPSRWQKLYVVPPYSSLIASLIAARTSLEEYRCPVSAASCSACWSLQYTSLSNCRFS